LHSKRWKHSIWVCIVYAHPIVIRSWWSQWWGVCYGSS
jgi:hypothetical protein